METWRRWKLRKTRSLEQAAYYRVAPRNRLIVGAVYIGLIALLVFGMHATHILSSGGHTSASTRLGHAPRRELSGALRARPRSMSRLVSRSRIEWRLSYRSLPRASAISTLACEPLK